MAAVGYLQGQGWIPLGAICTRETVRVFQRRFFLKCHPDETEESHTVDPDAYQHTADAFVVLLADLAVVDQELHISHEGRCEFVVPHEQGHGSEGVQEPEHGSDQMQEQVPAWESEQGRHCSRSHGDLPGMVGASVLHESSAEMFEAVPLCVGNDLSKECVDLAGDGTGLVLLPSVSEISPESCSSPACGFLLEASAAAEPAQVAESRHIQKEGSRGYGFVPMERGEFSAAVDQLKFQGAYAESPSDFSDVLGDDFF